MQTVYSVQELAERWGLSPQIIQSMEISGKLHRLPDIPGVRYAAAEAYQMENVGKDIQPLTAYERKQLEDKVKKLEELISEYQKKLIEVMRIAEGAKA